MFEHSSDDGKQHDLVHSIKIMVFVTGSEIKDHFGRFFKIELLVLLNTVGLKL